MKKEGLVNLTLTTTASNILDKFENMNSETGIRKRKFRKE